MQDIERLLSVIHSGSLTGALNYAGVLALLGLLGGFVIRRVGRRALRYDAPDHMAISLLGSSSVTLRLRAWCHDALAAHRLEYASYEEAKSRFAAAGIEIPYPYQNVVLKGRGKEEEGAGEHAL